MRNNNNNNNNKPWNAAQGSVGLPTQELTNQEIPIRIVKASERDRGLPVISFQF